MLAGVEDSGERGGVDRSSRSNMAARAAAITYENGGRNLSRRYLLILHSPHSVTWQTWLQGSGKFILLAGYQCVELKLRVLIT